MYIIRFVFLMLRRPPRSTRTDTLFPDTTLFRSAGAFALLGAGAAIWHVNQNDKLPIEQEYVLKPETHGMDCKSDDNLTACANEFGGRLDGLEYQKVMFVNNLDGQAIYIAGKFKRSQYEDAYDDFV